jgi:phage gp46-like protein
MSRSNERHRLRRERELTQLAQWAQEDEEREAIRWLMGEVEALKSRIAALESKGP